MCTPRQRRNPRFPHIFCRILYLTLDGGANLWYDRGAVLFVSEMALIDAAYCNSRFWLPRPRRTRSGTVPSGVRGVHWLCDIPVPGRWRNVRVRQEERAEPTGRSSGQGKRKEIYLSTRKSQKPKFKRFLKAKTKIIAISRKEFSMKTLQKYQIIVLNFQKISTKLLIIRKKT